MKSLFPELVAKMLRDDVGCVAENEVSYSTAGGEDDEHCCEEVSSVFHFCA